MLIYVTDERPYSILSSSHMGVILIEDCSSHTVSHNLTAALYFNSAETCYQLINATHFVKPTNSLEI